MDDVIDNAQKSFWKAPWGISFFFAHKTPVTFSLFSEKFSTLGQETCQIYTQANEPHTNPEEIILEATGDTSPGSVNTAVGSPQSVYLILVKEKHSV